MIVQHQDEVYGEARYDVLVLVGIAGVEQAVRAPGLTEVVDGLTRQTVIGGDRVGIERLRAGIHDILKLLVIRAVHIGVVHTAAQRAEADIPYRPQRGI